MTTALKLLSSMAPRELLATLCADYTRDTGQAIDAEAAGGVDVAKRVAAGEAVDIVVLASNAIDKLVTSGQLLKRVDLARSGIAVAIRQGDPRYDISTEAAMKAAVLAARTLSYSSGPSGVYIESLFARWGITPQIKDKIVVPPPGVPVGALLATGDCELGFQQLSEMMNLPGITVLGPLPADIQSITVFSGSVAAASRHAEAAHQVLAYMASADTASFKQEHGMEPA